MGKVFRSFGLERTTKGFKEVRPLLLELHMISFALGNASTLPKPDVVNFKQGKGWPAEKITGLVHRWCNSGTKERASGPRRQLVRKT